MITIAFQGELGAYSHEACMSARPNCQALPCKSFEEVISFGKKINKTLVITRSDKGSIVIKRDEVVECESQKNLQIVDLTGAGDLFAAGFLHGYINKLSSKECLEKGSEMASKIIQQIGARLF